MRVLVLLVALSLPAAAAAPEFRPGVERGFFPLGWSSRGDFAFGWYSESTIGAHTCIISVEVQDLTNDTALWSFEKKWQQSLEGKKRDPCPGSAGAAWEAISEAATKKLIALAVAPWRGEVAPRALPFASKSDSVSVALARADKGYTFSATSTTRGAKVLAKDQANACEAPALKGWFRHPEGGPLAVVVEWSASQAFCPAFQVLGCDVKSGFAKEKASPLPLGRGPG